MSYRATIEDVTVKMEIAKNLAKARLQKYNNKRGNGGGQIDGSATSEKYIKWRRTSQWERASFSCDIMKSLRKIDEKLFDRWIIWVEEADVEFAAYQQCCL